MSGRCRTLAGVHGPWPEEALALLRSALAQAPDGASGIAVFMLQADCPRAPATADEVRRVDELVMADVGRRLRGAAPSRHALLRGPAGEFVVIAQGLLDGGAVLGAAARLVHAFDDALQIADLPFCMEVAIGISFSAHHGSQPESLLAAAENGLLDALFGARMRRRGGDCANMATLDPAD